MKKLFALFLALILCLSLLVACGNDDDPSGPSSNPLPPAGDGGNDGDGGLLPPLDGSDNFGEDIEWDNLLG